VAVGDRDLAAVLFAEVHVRAIGLGLRAPPEDLVDGGRGGEGGRGTEDGPPRCVLDDGARAAAPLEKDPSEAGGRVDLQAALVERPPEGALQAQQQLDPLEAAQAQVALEGSFRRRGPEGAPAAELGEQLPHHLEHTLLGRFGHRSFHSSRVAPSRAIIMDVLEAVTLREIAKIFEVTDRLGIHREQLVIPLAPHHPGRVRRMPNGKIEIVVESEGSFDEWVAGLEPELQRAAAP
jgi:hypothetical protein